MQRFTKALVGMLVALLVTPVAFAGTTGKVAGRVTDAATGDPIPMVQVIIEETNQGTVTDAEGYYSIINVKPGDYTVRFQFVGYARHTIESVQVIVDQTRTLDVQMQEEVIEGQEIVVTAERPLVEMGRTTTTSYVDEKQMEALPVTNVGEVVNMQAGVVDGHFRGGRTGEVMYLVNGVPINNPMDNGAGITVEKNMVQGLEVISGVFNAEYGEAMSGVVNIVTKGVPNNWRGSLQADVGSIASGRKVEFVERVADADLQFYTVDDFRSVEVPLYEAADLPNWQNYQFDIGGPIFGDKLGLRLTGRYRHSESHVIGRDLFAPGDSSMNLNTQLPPEQWVIESTGTGDFMAGYNQRLFLNPNLVWQATPKLKLEYNAFITDEESRGISHFYKYVPTGRSRNYGFNQTHIGAVRLTLTNTSFANLSYSYMHDRSENRLYDIPDDFDETGLFDERYVSPRHSDLQGQAAFAVGGNDLGIWEGNTRTHQIVGDYTNQINRVHQVKAGFHAQFHHLDNQSLAVEVSPRTRWEPALSPSRYDNDFLDVKPRNFAAYIQDKMEFTNLIVNAGLRFDLFDANFEEPVDWSQASLERIPNLATPEPGDSILNRQETEIKYQLSPRLGIAFPISSSGVIRFSAGLFFQTPTLSLLYTNPEYEVNPAAGSAQFGNVGIEPERTLSFEVGLQQGLTESIGLELTVFSKDVRNLTGVEINRDISTLATTVRYIIRGITFSVFKRPVGDVFWNLDYTLDFAEGSASDPRQAFGRRQAGLTEIRRLNRLDWDRRHVFNNQITYAPSERFSLSLINRLQTGRPYTSSRDFVRSFIENNVVRPTHFTTDLRTYWAPFFLPENYQLFAEVNNLFDEKPAIIYNGFLATSDASTYDFLGRFIYLRFTQSY